MEPLTLTQLVPILQLAVGPVILISGVGLLLLTLTNRFGRMIDRTRSMIKEMSDERHVPVVVANLKEQVRILQRRSRILRFSITLAALSVLCVGVLIMGLFVAAFWRLELVGVLVAIFCTAILGLIGSMIALCGVMLVQVINVHYDATDFKSKIAEVQIRASGELAFPAIKLSDVPPGMRDGDRLTYRSTTGTSAINVHSVLEIDSETWVQTRDNLRTLRPGTEVYLESIQYTPPLLACSLVLGFASMLGLRTFSSYRRNISVSTDCPVRIKTTYPTAFELGFRFPSGVSPSISKHIIPSSELGNSSEQRIQEFA